jgi:hypothetical protein
MTVGIESKCIGLVYLSVIPDPYLLYEEYRLFSIEMIKAFIQFDSDTKGIWPRT